MFRHDECMERRSVRHDEEITDQAFHHMCVSLISAITWLAFCNACWQDLKQQSEMVGMAPQFIGENNTPKGWSLTCSMSADSLRRWAMSSDSVSRSLRRPDLYSWPTSSLWRLSFTWLTKKCITAFGTLRWRERERGNRPNRWLRTRMQDCRVIVLSPRWRGSSLTHQMAAPVEVSSCWSASFELNTIYFSLLSSRGAYTPENLAKIHFGGMDTRVKWSQTTWHKCWLYHHRKCSKILNTVVSWLLRWV